MTESNPILAVIQSIVDAIKLVDGLVVYDAISPEVQTPAVVVGPPALDFAAQCPSATSAEVEVFVVVDASERALERLYALTPLVAEAIDTNVRNAVVTAARPGLFPVGARELPAYSISVSIDL